MSMGNLQYPSPGDLIKFQFFVSSILLMDSIDEYYLEQQNPYNLITLKISSRIVADNSVISLNITYHTIYESTLGSVTASCLTYIDSTVTIIRIKI